MKRLWLAAGLVLGLSAIGCAGSVEIGDPDGWSEDALGEGSSSGDLAGSGCVLCSGAACVLP